MSNLDLSNISIYENFENYLYSHSISISNFLFTKNKIPYLIPSAVFYSISRSDILF